MLFGKNLKNGRIAAGMTQKELADSLNVNASTVTRWENGRNEPDYNTLIKLSAILKVEIDILLGNEVDKYSCFSFATDEVKMILEYRSLREDAKLKVAGYIDALKE